MQLGAELTHLHGAHEVASLENRVSHARPPESPTICFPSSQDRLKSCTPECSSVFYEAGAKFGHMHWQLPTRLNIATSHDIKHVPGNSAYLLMM